MIKREMVQVAPTVIFSLLILFMIYHVISPPRDSSELRPPSPAPTQRGLKSIEIENVAAFQKQQPPTPDYLEEEDYDYFEENPGE